MAAAPENAPPTIDPIAARRWRIVAPPVAPWLHDEVARRMEERLGWIKLKPLVWAHWDAVRGGLEAHGLLTRRYPQAEVYVDEATPERAASARAMLTPPWWSPRRWRGPRTHFGVPPDHAAQMVWANMLLHGVSDPQALIGRWHQALAVDGFLMFSCLGPDTLRELREVYQALGWPAPGHEFTDMHDWGDMLVHAGFAEPVMDMERIVLTYESPEALLRDLRSLGRNLHPARFGGLRGRRWHAQLLIALARRLAHPEAGGRLSLTFEIIYGHAFKPAPRIRLAAQSTVPLADMRAMLGGHRAGDGGGSAR